MSCRAAKTRAKVAEPDLTPVKLIVAKKGGAARLASRPGLLTAHLLTLSQHPLQAFCYCLCVLGLVAAQRPGRLSVLCTSDIYILGWATRTRRICSLHCKTCEVSLVLGLPVTSTSSRYGKGSNLVLLPDRSVINDLFKPDASTVLKPGPGTLGSSKLNLQCSSPCCVRHAAQQHCSVSCFFLFPKQKIEPQAPIPARTRQCVE